MTSHKMNHRQRMEACLAGAPMDRPPVALWRHFPVDDQKAERLAAATAYFQRTFDFDFVKVTPASSFCIQDWGALDRWTGASEGTRDYTHRVIDRPEDWANLPVLDPTTGRLGEQLQCLRLLVNDLGPEVPVIQTIFNPLSQAKNLVGQEKMLVHLRQYPETLHEGLRTISESIRRFIDAARDTGIAGVFYAVQHGQFGLLSSDEYEKFGRVYDLEVLRDAGDYWLNVLHIHGRQIMFDLFVDYPVQVINWHDRETYPSLQEAQDLFPGVVCGGLKRWETMVLGMPEMVVDEARQALDATGRRRFVLGTGCVVMTTTPYGNLLAARKSVE